MNKNRRSFFVYLKNEIIPNMQCKVPKPGYWKHLWSTLFCNGFCLLGPDFWFLGCTFAIQQVSTTLFFFYTTYYFIEKASWFFLFPDAILHILVTYNLLRGGLMDPGIIPPNTKMPKALKQKNHILGGRGTPMYRIPYDKHNTKIKWCMACNIFRPPRSSHCGICGVCIARADHHCPWLGNCVGKRNYRYFFHFVLFTFIYAIYTIIMMIIQIILLTVTYMIDKGEKVWTAFGQTFARNYMVWIILIYAYFPLLFCGMLINYHWYLARNNYTTREDIKDFYGEDEFNITPYFRESKKANFLEMIFGPSESLCGATHKSYIKINNILQLYYDKIAKGKPGNNKPVEFKMPRPKQQPKEEVKDKEKDNNNNNNNTQDIKAEDKTTEENKIAEENKNVQNENNKTKDKNTMKEERKKHEEKMTELFLKSERKYRMKNLIKPPPLLELSHETSEPTERSRVDRIGEVMEIDLIKDKNSLPKENTITEVIKFPNKLSEENYIANGSNSQIFINHQEIDIKGNLKFTEMSESEV